MSYSISHHLCNCSLTSTIYWLPVGTHVSRTDPCFVPEEQLASTANFGQALAKMKCPSNYLSGLTKYVPTSSILPMPVAISGYVLYGRCIMHVVVNMSTCFSYFPYLFIDNWAIFCSGRWYVSNVSIIFDCSMLLYYLFWMLMGFILHYYIIFGTNL